MIIRQSGSTLATWSTAFNDRFKWDWFECLFHPVVKKTKNAWLKRLAMGLFYEHGSFGRGQLFSSDGNHRELISLSRFTNINLRVKYRHEHLGGIKASFSLN